MQKQVALFEFSVFQGVFPLASGYLQTAARRDPEIRQHIQFHKHSWTVATPALAGRVAAVEADVYGFSCYVWNMGLVRRAVALLRERRPDVPIILGGPQVMNKAERYLDKRDENLVLCNGEGEETFSSYLKELLSCTPDLTRVSGLSMYRGDRIITTAPQQRLRNPNDIPSPYLEGCFDPHQYVWAVIETNRGCPFRCTYCYWGAATNAVVNRYAEARVMDEIAWLADHKVLYVFIADANFGMLRRDVDIARRFAECKKQFGYPQSVYFSSSKNTPERVTEIAAILDEAKLMSTQPISLQTMSADSLVAVKRDNIRVETYTKLQRVLNTRGISSFIEIIWPLPGETLESFKDGCSELCALGADSFIVYPLLVINNVEMETECQRFALKTVDDPDPNSEAKIVVGTDRVNDEEYSEGLRFSCHLTTLYSARALWHVARHLNDTGQCSYRDTIDHFGLFCRSRRSHSYVAYVDSMIASSRQFQFSAVGGMLHLALHASREEYDQLLLDFLASQQWCGDDQARVRLELDLLSRPHIYCNTPVHDKGSRLQLIRIERVLQDGYEIRVPRQYMATICQLLNLEETDDDCTLHVKYRTTQLPFMKGKRIDDNFAYCQDRLHRMRSLLPQWRTSR